MTLKLSSNVITAMNISNSNGDTFDGGVGGIIKKKKKKNHEDTVILFPSTLSTFKHTLNKNNLKPTCNYGFTIVTNKTRCLLLLKRNHF